MLRRVLLLLGAAGAISAAAARADTVTFDKDIAPITQTHCASCHRPGQPGPFSLLTFADARRRARLIASVTASRYMPPWKSEAGHGDFAGERRLTDTQIRAIRDWVDQGAPEGDAKDLPPPRTWTEGWQLGEPDLVLEMPEAHALGASGSDVLRNFVIPIPVTARRYVKGIEFKPGNPRVVHHATMRIDQTRTSSRLDEADPAPGYEGIIPADAQYPDGHFLAWTPGQLTPLSEDGSAWRLEPRSDLVVQLHLVPSGRPESVRVRIGLFLTDVAPTRTPSMIRLSREDIDIAPGEREYVLEDRYVLPVDVELRELQPHAHLLARRVEADARLPDGTTRPLIRIADWDFRWQDVYRLKQPLRLPAGTALQLRITYDNSSSNARNPFSPPRRIRFGERTTDEMGALWLQVLPRSPQDLATLQRDVDRKSTAEDIVGYKHLLASDPDNPGLHEGLASSYLRLGNGLEALNELETSVRLDPRSAMGQYNLATALLVQGRSAEAIARFEEAIRLKPSLASAHNSLGVALKAAGRIDEGIARYRQALAIDPEYAHAHNNLGAALQARGNFEEAIAEYALAVRANPTDPVPHRNWAKALAIHGDAAQATGRFRAALVVAPDSPALLADFAWLLAVHTDAQVRSSGEAVELAERAAMLTGDRDPAVLDVLAAAYAGVGRFGQAIAVARSAIAFASQRNSKRLAGEVERRLDLYETHCAYTHAFAGGFGR
jgi:tetratricopeptide (TPR) repeat protein